MSRRSDAAVVRRLLLAARYEVLPTARIEEVVTTSLPVGRTVTVTASPAKGLEATVDLSIRLAEHGYDVVPHLAARMVSSRAELAEITARLKAAGIGKIFVPAGDAERPGEFPGALELLEALVDLGDPFGHVGVAGYPEDHPTIIHDRLVQAMWDKRHHATEIVSNLTFDPAALTDWVRRVRARGVTTPILVGLPGPVERAKLLTMATKIGVGESTRFLAKNTGMFARIAAPGGFSPERFLTRAAPDLDGPEAVVSGLHLFTFNQVVETEAWRRDLLTRLGGDPQ
ncbi:methylenetetrahydrofolate reductase (NADPH) [Nocardioides sp. YR527]|uniref:methylenetetrahydrofolate reductase n=1 Tax=Nocardioides sp. YR527 TaxID=1881028 RepID=UPI00087F944E|nr:methylenetetrahydrofolate reductase [Nocardioides sp. YR527]SDK67003.1 methylenetetrahydrofolate reductase (NADPH) [Nocardioides sp. YR527]